MVRTIPAVAAVLLLCASPAAAQAPKPEEAVKMRQGVMTAIKWQFGAIVAVSKGEAPFSEDTAARAKMLTALAKLAPQGFTVPSGSDVVKTSDAKPSLWTDTAKVALGWTSLATETERLLIATQSRDPEKLKEQVAAVGKVCKTCHDAYKEE